MAYRVRTVRDLEEFIAAIGGDRPLLRLAADRGGRGALLEDPPVRADARRLRRRPDRRRRRRVPARADAPDGPGAVRRRHGRRRAPVSPAPRPSPADDGCAAAGHPRARRAGRGALGLRGDHLRPLRVRARVARARTSRPKRTQVRIRPELPREGGVRLIDHDEAMRVLPRIYERDPQADAGLRLALARTGGRLVGSAIGPRAAAGRAARPRAARARRAARGLRALPDRAGRGDVRRVDERPSGSSRSWGVDEAARRRPLALPPRDRLDRRRPGRALPVDDPLLLLVDTAQRARRSGSTTGSGSVPSTCRPRSRRAPSRDGRATIEITADPQFPENVGTWTVEAGGVRQALVRRPDVRLDVRGLGSTLLGGFTFAELAAPAGRRRVPAAGSRARTRSSGPSARRGARRSSDPPRASTLEGR